MRSRNARFLVTVCTPRQNQISGGMEGDVLLLRQKEGGLVRLDEQGSVCLSLPVKRSDKMMAVSLYRRKPPSLREVFSIKLCFS